MHIPSIKSTGQIRYVLAHFFIPSLIIISHYFYHCGLVLVYSMGHVTKQIKERVLLVGKLVREVTLFPYCPSGGLEVEMMNHKKPLVGLGHVWYHVLFLAPSFMSSLNFNLYICMCLEVPCPCMD